MKIRESSPPLSILPPVDHTTKTQTANPLDVVSSILSGAGPEGAEPGLLEAFQRLTGTLMEAPKTLLRAGNEQEIADFLKQGRFDQQQILQDLRTVSNTMSRMPAGQELLLASGQNGVVSLSPQQGLVNTVLGDASLRAKGEAAALAFAQGQATLNQDGLKAQGQAGAELKVGGRLNASVQNALLQSNTQIDAGASLGAKGQGNLQADLSGVQAQGKVGAQAMVGIQAQNQTRTAGLEVGGERLDVNADVKASAIAGAKAGAEVDVAATIVPPRAGIDAQAGAFAGAKAGVEGKVGLGDFVALKGKAEAWAGAGAQAGLIAGLKDGKLRFGFHAGAAVKAGAGFRWSVEVDVQKIAKAMVGGSLQLAERGLEFALDPLGATERTVQDIGAALSQKQPGTVSLGSKSSPLPLSQLVAPLLEQTNVQKRAEQTVQKAVTDLLGPDITTQANRS